MNQTNKNKNNNRNNKNNKNKNKNLRFRFARPKRRRFNFNNNYKPGISYNKISLPNFNFRNLQNKYFKGIRDYIFSLINPELSVNSSFIAKQPSYTPIPTSNVTFKEQIDFQTDENGNFACLWIPNFLSTKPSLDKHIPIDADYKQNFYSHFYYKNSTFSSNLNNVWHLHTSLCPKIDLAKYRLVSAKCSVQYNGALIQKSGQLHSCAIYTDMPVFIGKTKEELTEDVFFDFYVDTSLNSKLRGIIDVENIRNGLWNKYVNVTTSSGRIDNVALPTDPTDHTFYPLSHYYSVEPGIVLSDEISSLKSAESSDGGHLSYVMAGKNILTSNNTPNTITVLIYYNFEIIATQETAAFLRSKKNDDEIYEQVMSNGKKIIQEVANNILKENVMPGKPTEKIIIDTTKKLIGSGKIKGEL